MIRKMVEKYRQRRIDAVKQAVNDYLSSLPDEILVPAVAKLLGAEGLTEQNFKRLIETANGDKIVTVYFGDGNMFTISSRNIAENRGPGW